MTLATGARQLSTALMPFVPKMTQTRLSELHGSLDSPITVAIVGGTSGMREGVADETAQRLGLGGHHGDHLALRDIAEMGKGEAQHPLEELVARVDHDLQTKIELP